jgi:hypothetical protein
MTGPGEVRAVGRKFQVQKKAGVLASNSGSNRRTAFAVLPLRVPLFVSLATPFDHSGRATASREASASIHGITIKGDTQ